MNSLLACIFLSWFASPVPPPSSFTKEVPLWEKMQSLAWKNRVIVLYAPEANSKEFQQQKQILAAQTKELNARDIVVIECVGKTLSAEDKNYIVHHFMHDGSGYGVWLVGKDGGTKLAETKPVTTEKFFSLIDSMPMRQSEIKRDGK